MTNDSLELPISDADVEEVDSWQPGAHDPSQAVGDDDQDHDMASNQRRLLLCLEIAVRDCREAASKVERLLPAMTAVADRIESEAGSTHRVLVAALVGGLIGVFLTLEFAKRGWI